MTTQNAALATAQILGADIYSRVREALDEAMGELGRFNLLAVGNTGAGKSSLINAMFGWEVAETGTGQPVTQGTDYYEHPHLPLGFFDTRGLEMGEGIEDLTRRLVGEVTVRRSLDVADQIHVAWYCVRWSDRRLEEGQLGLIRALAAAGLPVMIVLTQVPLKDGAYHPGAIEFARFIQDQDLPIGPGAGIFMTAAVDDPWTGPAHGIRELLSGTMDVAPEGARAALSAAQQVDVHRKRQAAKAIVAQHSALAASAAATPIPMADAVAIVPIQIAMIARITAVWGLDVARSTLATVIGSALLSGGATLLGRALVSNLLRLVPGVGWMAGAPLSAAVAGTLTGAVGGAWTLVAEELSEADEDVEQLSPEEIRERFHRHFRNRGDR